MRVGFYTNRKGETRITLNMTEQEAVNLSGGYEPEVTQFRELLEEALYHDEA